MDKKLSQINITVVVPAFNVERELPTMLASIPKIVKHVIVVDDCSTDKTWELANQFSEQDVRVKVIHHNQNQGVGGSMITGFRTALEYGTQIIIKMDGDGQMDPDYIPALIHPLIKGNADFTKGNRFRDFRNLQRMPLARRIGNLGLSFLSKLATGYWNLFDPTNGFFAFRADVLKHIELNRLDKRYYFETSLLSQLYLANAVVMDVPIPARYLGETSHLSIGRVLLEFPIKLWGTFWRRILLKYFVFDFSIISIYLLTGIPLVFFGLIFGITKWIHYANLQIPAPTGTVMLPTLSLLLGMQLLISAIQIDLGSVPKKPITDPITEISPS